MRNSKKGFSLIEIIVTVAVMAALMAMLIPSFISAQYRTRVQQDETKFDSICTAFKSALGEPEVIKELKDYCDDAKITVTLSVSNEGLIVFGEGILEGNLKDSELESTTLWLNSYQSVGLTYTTESHDFKGKKIVFNIVPKTEHTTAQCEYKVQD